ncbi:MAG: mechanosensitive ion channel family protein [Desulfocapsa sp.]|nr:mechanosensitive ion channel family protein [Desulfocapsa sp.]
MDVPLLDKLDAFLLTFPLLQEYDFLERLVIVLIYAVLAKIIDLLLMRSLRSLADKTRMHFDDYLISFFHRPFLATVVLFGVLHACSVEPQLPYLYGVIIPGVSKSLILLVWWGAISSSLSKTSLEEAIHIFGGKHIDPDIFLLFKNVSRILILFFTILWILLIWKVNLSPLFASAGIIGIAIALAARDTLANFFGGVSVFMDRAYKVGEYIILDSGERGEVVEVGIRSTKIKTRDDVMIIIPNGIMANSKIINESAPQPRFRLRLDIGVAYGTDLDLVEDLLLQVADENNQVVKQPPPRLRLRSFGDSAVNFQLLLWVRDPREKGRQTHLLFKEVYRCFNENAISIPFPQRDIHVRKKEEMEEVKAEG